jgi:hypothetical protein
MLIARNGQRLHSSPPPLPARPNARPPPADRRSRCSRCVQALSEAAPAGVLLSTNDVASSLVWVLMASLRRRPLPGQRRPPDMQHTTFGFAVDLRCASEGGRAAVTAAAAAAAAGGLSAAAAAAAAAAATQTAAAQQLPPDYFGNAAWSVQAQAASCPALSGGVLPAWSASCPPAAYDGLCSSREVLQCALRAGAVGIRTTISRLRRDPGAASAILRQVHATNLAPPAAQVRARAGVLRSAGLGRPTGSVRRPAAARLRASDCQPRAQCQAGSRRGSAAVRAPGPLGMDSTPAAWVNQLGPPFLRSLSPRPLPCPALAAGHGGGPGGGHGRLCHRLAVPAVGG